MERIALKGTGLEVSRIALGTWAFGGGAGWCDQGRSAEVVGERDRAVIATKVHETLDRAGVIAACEASLRRLKTDYIDVYYVHWPERGVPLAETVGALAR